MAYTAPISVRISLAKAISKPPSRHSRPCVRWLASWLWMLMPTCTMPQPRIIMPMALIMEKIKSDHKSDDFKFDNLKMYSEKVADELMENIIRANQNEKKEKNKLQKRAKLN